MFATPFLLVFLAPVAADPQVPAKGRVYVDVDGRVNLSMSTRKGMARVEVDKAGVLEAEATNDRAVISLSGKSPGKVQVLLTDDNGAKEKYEVIVICHVRVPLGVRLTWQWPTADSIKDVAAKESKIARVQRDPKDARCLSIEPVAEGSTEVTLSDGKGKSEAVLLIVRKPHHLIAVGESRTIRPTTMKPVRGIQLLGSQFVETEWKGSGQVDPFNDKNRLYLSIKDADPKGSAVLTGRLPGLVQLHIIDADGNAEELWIGVKPKE
jgi:hypothetical protein